MGCGVCADCKKTFVNNLVDECGNPWPFCLNCTQVMPGGFYMTYTEAALSGKLPKSKRIKMSDALIVVVSIAAILISIISLGVTLLCVK